MSILKNNVVVGITAALAATVIAPVLIPIIKKSSRPLAKSLIRGGVMLYEKGRETMASAGEMMEDVIAEVRAESMGGQAAAIAAAAATGAASESGMAGQPDRPLAGNGAGTIRGSGNGQAAPQVERGGPT